MLKEGMPSAPVAGIEPLARVGLRRSKDRTRCTAAVGGHDLSGCLESKPPVQEMGKRSVAQHQCGRGSPMTVVPHTGAIRASACSRTQQPLRCSQREHVLRSDVSNAAYRTFATRIRVIAIAGRGSILISRYAQVDCSATRVQAEHRRCAFPSRLRAPGTAPSTSVGRPAERPRSATTRRCSAPGRWSSH